MSTFSADVGFSASSKSKPFAWRFFGHNLCTCDPHFGCMKLMKPVGLRLSWWIQLSMQQMNPRCHKRTCKVIHFAQTAKIFICTWKNLTKNSKVRNGQWSHAAISCSTCDYIPSFKGMPILNVGSISCPVPCHLDQGKAPGKLANRQKSHSHKDWSSRWCQIRKSPDLNMYWWEVANDERCDYWSKNFSWGSTSKWAGSPPSSSSPSSSMSFQWLKPPGQAPGHYENPGRGIYRHLLSSSWLLRGQPGKGLKLEINKKPEEKKHTLLTTHIPEVWCLKMRVLEDLNLWSETRDLKLAGTIQNCTNNHKFSIILMCHG